MNLLLLDETEFMESNRYRLGYQKSKHLLEIKKAKLEDKIKCGRINLDLGIFIIEKLEEDNIIGNYIKLQEKDRRSPGLDLYIAYQRPQTMKKILFIAGMLEIKKITVFPITKSEKSYESSSLWQNERWKDEVILGMEQGKNIYPTDLDRLSHKSKIKNFLLEGIVIILDASGESLKKVFSSIQSQRVVHIIIGPEGGFTIDDLSYFKQFGGIVVSLGKIPLRTEYALTTFVAQLDICKEIYNDL